MAEEVEHSSQHWTDQDLMAVAVYLKDGAKPVDAAQPVAATDASMVTGKAIYADRCSACHTPTGEGIANLFPKLAMAPLINSNDPSSLIRVVLSGSRAGATDADPDGAGHASVRLEPVGRERRGCVDLRAQHLG